MPTGPADMLVHVSCSGIRPRRRWALRTRGGRQLHLKFETSRPQCLSCSQPTPSASGRQNSYNRCVGTRHGRDSIGPLRDIVQDQVDTLEEQQANGEWCLITWTGWSRASTCLELMQSLAKAAFSSVPPCRGFKLNMVTGVVIGGESQQYHAIHAGDRPTEIYINVLLVGNLACWPCCHLSYAPTRVNPRRPGIASLRRCRDGTGMSQNENLPIRVDRSREWIQNNWWAWAGFGLVWVG